MILISCLFIAVLLPYITKLPIVYAIKQEGGYNNNYPRWQQANLKGFGARALAGHQNSFESLIVFSTAVLAALATGHTSKMVELLAITHIIARVIYHILYLMNLATLRSLVWLVGLVCSLSILGTCL